MTDRSAPLARAAARLDPLRELRAALALLTRMPVGSGAVHGATGAVAFPIVGTLVGAIGLVPLAIVGPLEPVIAALLAVAAMAVVSGALHLDGLADTADALIAPDAARAERARKDPSVGVGGVVALVVVLGLDVAALAGLVTETTGWQAGLALVMAAVVARTVGLVSIVTERPRVAADGFGAWFAARVRPAAVLAAAGIAVAIVAAVTILGAMPALAIGGFAGAAIGLALARGIVIRRGQLDGDGLGAIVELTLSASLVATALADAVMTR